MPELNLEQTDNLKNFIQIPKNVFWPVAFNFLELSIKTDNPSQNPEDFILPLFAPLQNNQQKEFVEFLELEGYQRGEQTKKAYELLVQVFHRESGNPQAILDTNEWVLLSGYLDISLLELNQILIQYLKVANEFENQPLCLPDFVVEKNLPLPSFKSLQGQQAARRINRLIDTLEENCLNFLSKNCPCKFNLF